MAAWDTGQGTTVTFGTSGWTADVIRVNPGSHSRDAIDVMDLSMTGFLEKEPADLADPGEIEIEFYFDTKTALAEPPDINSAAESITIDFPQRSGESANADITGTGFITGIDWPELATNEGQTGTLRFVWDGKTGPALTLAT